jgi:(2Fe-2S) ferredoxin
MTGKRFQILVCDGPSCGVCHGSERLVEHIVGRVESDPALRERVEVCNLTCFGRCDDGPNMLVRELAEGEEGSLEPPIEKLEGVRGLYLGMDETRIDRMLDEHCGGDRPIAEWVETYS